jgi:opacity protein-like surface antigen
VARANRPHGRDGRELENSRTREGRTPALVCTLACHCGQSFGDSETNAGFNFGGGAEYFLTRNFSLKGEGRYHVINDTRTGLDPSGFAITGGVKKYF